MNALTINTDTVLAKCAAEIRKLSKSGVQDVQDLIKTSIEIGRQLTIAKTEAGHGHWIPWLEREFPQYTDRRASELMRLYEFSLSNRRSIADLGGKVDITGLLLLAAPKTTEAAFAEVERRVAAGKKVTVKEIKAVVESTKPKTEKAGKANKASTSDVLPSEEEAHESWQAAVYDQACFSLKEMEDRNRQIFCITMDHMDDKTRQRFFAHIKRKIKRLAAPKIISSSLATDDNAGGFVDQANKFHREPLDLFVDFEERFVEWLHRNKQHLNDDAKASLANAFQEAADGYHRLIDALFREDTAAASPAVRPEPEPEPPAAVSSDLESEMSKHAHWKRLSREDRRFAKLQVEQAEKNWLALRAAWMREHAGNVADWEQLGEDEQSNYREERIARRNAENDAVWLADHNGKPKPHYCEMNTQELEYWDELFARNEDFTDPHFDLPADHGLQATSLHTEKVLSKFGTAIIDPPWPYNKTSNHKKLTGYADKKYNLLSIKELQSLKIEGLADYVFLWTTGPFMEEAYKLLDCWGLEPVTVLVWVKTAKKSEITQDKDGVKFKPHYGIGYWFRGCTEPIILAKRPGAPSIPIDIAGLIGPSAGHSKKPLALHELVEARFPGPYLEIFARESRLGWRCIGNEAPGDGCDIRVSLEGLNYREDTAATSPSVKPSMAPSVPPADEPSEASSKRLSREQQRLMKQQAEQGEKIWLALSAAWMREHAGNVADWERLGEDGQSNYHSERVARRREEMHAAWLADHNGEPMPHFCGMDDQEVKYWDELFLRTPDFTDQHFDLPVDHVEAQPDAAEPAAESPITSQALASAMLRETHVRDAAVRVKELKDRAAGHMAELQAPKDPAKAHVTWEDLEMPASLRRAKKSISAPAPQGDATAPKASGTYH
jgi:N6-adenosine-specific RNA methylase IME4